MEKRRTMRKLFNQKHKPFFVAIFVALPIWAGAVFGGQASREQETKVQNLLSQADVFYIKQDYKKAIDTYLEASQLAESKLNLSRAYFGLSLSHFYLQDAAGAKKWLIRVLEVDRYKEISALFYPETFVKLFQETKQEISGKSGVGAKEETGAGAAAQQQTRETKEQSQPRALSQPTEQKYSPQSTPSIQNIDFGTGGSGGHWEVEVHYSSWGLNLVKSAFESDITKRLGREIRKDLTEVLSRSHVSLTQSAYEQKLSFDSGGSNYGMEVRYYPKGREGSFSLGFSLEKTRIRLDLAGSVKQFYSNGSLATVNASAYVETEPFSTNFSFRWDFMPSWRVTPYFVFGIGLGPWSGNIGYSYKGTYEWRGAQESVEDSKVKTFNEFAEEEGSYIRLELFVLVQASLGVKAEVFRGITLRVEGGFWDGLVLRGGLAFRF